MQFPLLALQKKEPYRNRTGREEMKFCEEKNFV